MIRWGKLNEIERKVSKSKCRPSLEIVGYNGSLYKGSARKVSKAKVQVQFHIEVAVQYCPVPIHKCKEIHA
jgi:hypothetical protein